MKPDTYTKTVLTIIAICLSILVFKEIEIIPKAHAGTPTNSLQTNYGLIPLNRDGSINVKFNSDQIIDVRLRGIDEASDLRWEAIKVKVVN